MMTKERNIKEKILQFFKEIQEIQMFLYFIIDNFGTLLKKYMAFIILIISFGIFLIINNGVVVGDRTAHQMNIHVPQLLYFFVFTCGFNVWRIITLLPTLQKHLFSQPYRIIFYFIAISWAFLIFVDRFTIAHPYLLADNRHYVFYIWQRIIARTPLSRFLMVPLYTIAFLILWKMFEKKKILISFALLWRYKSRIDPCPID